MSLDLSRNIFVSKNLIFFSVFFCMYAGSVNSTNISSFVDRRRTTCVTFSHFKCILCANSLLSFSNLVYWFWICSLTPNNHKSEKKIFKLSNSNELVLHVVLIKQKPSRIRFPYLVAILLSIIVNERITPGTITFLYD